jgi:transportin-3
LHPFYQNVSTALDVDSLFEVTEGVAHVVAAQPTDRIYEIMRMFCQPIAAQLVAYQAGGLTQDEKVYRKIAGMSLF